MHNCQNILTVSVLQKGYLYIFALSPAVIHSIVFSVVLSIYFAQKTIVCVVQFRPLCQVWRLGPLDLTH